MSDIDPFEILQGSNPYPLDVVAGADSAVGQRVRVRVDELVDERSGQSGQRKVSYLVAALVATALLVAAGWAIRRATVSDPVTTLCFVDLDETSYQSQNQVQVTGSTTNGCEVLWESGELTNLAIAELGAVPPLLGCVAEDGLLWVFPTDDIGFCRELGLSRQELDLGESPVAEVQALLVAAHPPGSCSDAQAVRQSAEQFLAELEGLEEWSVAVAPGDGDGLCASFSVDATIMQVVIVPVPPEE